MTSEKIVDILAQYKKVSTTEIQRERMFREMGLDSLDMAELLMRLEDEFGVSLELDPGHQTIADLAAAIDAHLH
jgi:acyl carrier protein